jgi:hypothetical protein
MTEAAWPTEADVARMRESTSATGAGSFSNVAIRVSVELLPPGLVEELRQELARPDPDPADIDTIFRRLEG